MFATLRIALVSVALVSAACGATPVSPDPVASVTFVPTMSTAAAPSQNSHNINVDPASGMLPCDWAALPVCGREAFAVCVQHGTGTGRPGPMAHWEWSEWQCFPDSYLPRR